jgi:hypothetical protein
MSSKPEPSSKCENLIHSFLNVLYTKLNCLSDDRAGKKIADATYSFNLDGEATLSCFGGFTREEVLKHSVWRYEAYAVQNAKHLKTFFEKNGLRVPLSDLILVTDCTRAASWVTSVRSNTSTSAHFGVQVQIDSLANVNLFLESHSSHSSGLQWNRGPTARSGRSSRARDAFDQCLFVQGVSIASLRVTDWVAILGAGLARTVSDSGNVHIEDLTQNQIVKLKEAIERYIFRVNICLCEELFIDSHTFRNRVSLGLSFVTKIWVRILV